MVNQNNTRFENVISPLCSHGYAAGFGFINGIPQSMSITFPKDWFQKYHSQDYSKDDPVIQWGMEHEGHLSWNELKDLGYSNKIFDAARDFGIANGTVIAVVVNQIRCIVGITHNAPSASMDTISTVYGELCLAASQIKIERPIVTKPLQFLQLHSEGLSESNIAQHLGISIQSVRARRKKILELYGATTVAQAAKIAIERRDI